MKKLAIVKLALEFVVWPTLLFACVACVVAASAKPADIVNLEIGSKSPLEIELPKCVPHRSIEIKNAGSAVVKVVLGKGDRWAFSGMSSIGLPPTSAIKINAVADGQGCFYDEPPTVK